MEPHLNLDNDYDNEDIDDDQLNQSILDDYIKFEEEYDNYYHTLMLDNLHYQEMKKLYDKIELFKHSNIPKIFTNFCQIPSTILQITLNVLKFRSTINKRIPNVIIINNNNFLKYLLSFSNIIHYVLTQ